MGRIELVEHGSEEVRQTRDFVTPNGNPATFMLRLYPETTDWNTAISCLTEDEYALRGLHFTGWALDIGAYIGGIAVGLLIDNPDLRVVAVEPIPENAALIEENAELNGVRDRLVVLQGAADAPGVKTVQVTWNWGPDAKDVGTFNVYGHRFIGNVGFPQSDHELPHELLICPAYSIGDLLELAGAPRFSFVKIDCEGCEARFFLDPDVYKLDRIHGEWHPPHATVASMHSMLDKSHTLDIWGPGEAKEIGYGRGFVAVRK